MSWSDTKNLLPISPGMAIAKHDSTYVIVGISMASGFFAPPYSML